MPRNGNLGLNRMLFQALFLMCIALPLVETKSRIRSSDAASYPAKMRQSLQDSPANHKAGCIILGLSISIPRNTILERYTVGSFERR